MKRVEASYLRAGSPQKLMLGLSGGADSMALALVLIVLREQHGFALRCIHIHHGLRTAADLDEAFVRAFCLHHELSLKIKRVHVLRAGSLEAEARAARYEAFYEELAADEGEVLVLAHHMDDQAETMLMRMMAGTGGTGLSAMRERTGAIWRPLLDSRRHDIMQYLMPRGQAWREDESNEDERHFRNALRRRLMPVVEDMSPAAVPNLYRTSIILADEEEYWAGYTRDWLNANASTAPPFLFLMVQPLLEQPIAVQRRVLRALCAQANIALDFAQTQRLVSLLHADAGSITNLPAQVRAYRSRDRLHLMGADPPVLPLGRLDTVSPPAERDRRIETFDQAKLDGARLRFRQAGDRIAPLGTDGTQSLKDYLINRHVDRPLRGAWPVLARGQDILWVVGVGMAQTAALDDATNRRVTFRYVGRLPDEYGDQTQRK